MSNRFDLDIALSAWRRSLEYNRPFGAADLDELERHMRDQVEALVRRGVPQEEAFHRALQEMGSYSAVEAEYRKVYWGKRRRQRELLSELTWRISMLKNYVKMALRHLKKQKGYAFINVFGLAFGLTCFILISLFVQFELSYDTFHEKADRIYRIIQEHPTLTLGETHWFASTPEPLINALLDEFPEVEHVTQIVHANSLFEHDGVGFYEDGVYVTEQFFDVFSFRLVHGNPRTVLLDPQSVVLTESLAQKYFGDANPVGQTLTVSHSGEHFNGKHAMQVTGVVEDVPANSHFTFDFLAPVSSSRELSMWFGSWESNSYLTYAVLRPDHSLPAFTAKLPELAQKYLSQTAYYTEHPDEIVSYAPQLLTDIHLRSHINHEFGVNGDIKYVYLFSAIAVLILLIAAINYINLTTARSATRALEVGVRKVMGAHRRQLIGQFMGEAIMPSVLALLLALGLVVLLVPTLNNLTGRQIVLDMAQQGDLLAMLLLIGLGVGVLAGAYPAFMMASFHPVSMMKGMLQRKAGKPTLCNTLVVVQFTITIMLLISTFVIQGQLRYMQTASTGVDRDQVVSIAIQDRMLHEQYAALKQTLEQHPNVRAVSAAQSDPTAINSSSRANAWEGHEDDQSIQVYRSIIQHGYIDLFGLELVEGRDFSEAIVTDERGGMLINETLKRALGWETAVGKRFDFHGREARITGVVKDFNFRSFHQPVAPVALFLESGWWFPYQRLFVKLGPGDMPETLAFLEETLATFSPEYPFDYHFLDDAYNGMYETEMRLGSLFNAFTILALVIACLGLFGLAMLTASQRTKEIGVRKVLGASVVSILVLLSKDVTRLVMIAFAVGTPIAYLAMNTWLQDFAYRIDLSWLIFLGAGLTALGIALFTISYQSIKAALADPVKSLRYE